VQIYADKKKRERNEVTLNYMCMLNG